MSKIMIIEDTKTIREELKTFLIRYGYEVVAPTSFEDIFGLRCTVIRDPVSDSPSVVPIGRYHNNLRMYS